VNAAIRARARALGKAATLRSPGKLPNIFHAVSFLRRMCVFPERELALAFFTGRLEALYVALASAEDKKQGLDALDAWVRDIKKYIDTWCEGVHDPLTHYPNVPRTSTWLLDALRASLPRLPNAPALTALLTQFTCCLKSFSRPVFDFRAWLPPHFLKTWSARVSGIWGLLQSRGRVRAYTGDELPRSERHAGTPTSLLLLVCVSGAW